MTQPMLKRYLEEAEHNVAEGFRRISEQEERVEQLASSGHDVKQSRRLLYNLYALRLQFEGHLKRLRQTA